jgi:hypothetical protein
MSIVSVSDPLTVPSWIMAIATVVLAVGAGFTVFYAKQAFDKQAAALGKLTTQVNDQVRTNVSLRAAADSQVAEIAESLARLQRENDARRRAQASQIFIWTTTSTSGSVGWAAAAAASRPKTVAHVKNASDRPVYQLELTWKIGAAALPPPDRIPTLLPGEEKTRERDTHPGADHDPFGPDLQFTDAEGRRWLLTLGGSLSEAQPPGQSAAAGPAV